MTVKVSDVKGLVPRQKKSPAEAGLVNWEKSQVGPDGRVLQFPGYRDNYALRMVGRGWAVSTAISLHRR